MQIRWLGWSGVELEAGGERLLIDPLADPSGTFAPLGEAAAAVELPEVVAVNGGGCAGALLTHLHRDHADAGALSAALAPGAAAHHPSGETSPATAQAEHELAAAGIQRHPVAAWDSLTIGPFSCTALPAVDGLGDPQVAWLVEAGGTRVLHLGDTMFHGAWWRLARSAGPFDVVFVPINGAVVDYPHQQPASPLPAVMEPEQAALAAELLGASTVVPMHYGGYFVEPFYRPTPDARARFGRAAHQRPYRVAAPAPGEMV